MRNGFAALCLVALAAASACDNVANGGRLSQPSTEPAVAARTLPWDTMPCTAKCELITDIALATDGTLYVAEQGGDQILTLPSGSTTWAAGPIKGSYVEHVVVGPHGDVYATTFVPGPDHAELIKIDATTRAQSVFSADGVGSPDAIAVAESGNVYVAGHSRKGSAAHLFVLPAGESTFTQVAVALPPEVDDMAVDQSGALVIKTQDRVLKLHQNATEVETLTLPADLVPTLDYTGTSKDRLRKFFLSDRPWVCISTGGQAMMYTVGSAQKTKVNGANCPYLMDSTGTVGLFARDRQGNGAQIRSL